LLPKRQVLEGGNSAPGAAQADGSEKNDQGRQNGRASRRELLRMGAGNRSAFGEGQALRRLERAAASTDRPDAYLRRQSERLVVVELGEKRAIGPSSTLRPS